MADEFRIEPWTAFARLNRLARAAGVVKRTHPHMLRQSFATTLLRRNVNLRITQRVMRDDEEMVFWEGEDK